MSLTSLRAGHWFLPFTMTMPQPREEKGLTLQCYAERQVEKSGSGGFWTVRLPIHPPDFRIAIGHFCQQAVQTMVRLEHPFG